jgi:hypothetical protein
MNKKIVLYLFVCIAAIVSVSWWAYTTFTYVEFDPGSRVNMDFYSNLRIVLDANHINYIIDAADHPEIPLKIARDKELVRKLADQAQDIVWLYNHSSKQYPSFVCFGEGYKGFVFKKDYNCYEDTLSSIGLSCEDVKLTERILKTFKRNQWTWDVLLPLYTRQYHGYLAPNRDVIIDIFLTSQHSGTVTEQRDGTLWVKHGGKGIIDVRINLTQKTFVYFMPHPPIGWNSVGLPIQL